MEHLRIVAVERESGFDNIVLVYVNKRITEGEVNSIRELLTEQFNNNGITDAAISQESTLSIR